MPGAHNHRFILNFMKTVRDNYVKDGRSHDFILDLLGINVPKLFGLPEDTDKGHPVAVEVQSEFSAFIQSYIHHNALNHFFICSSIGTYVTSPPCLKVYFFLILAHSLLFLDNLMSFSSSF